jgi:hypothetical protein
MARLIRTAQLQLRAPSVAGGEHSRTSSMAASSVHYHTQSMASFPTLALSSAAGGAESAVAHRRAASHQMSALRESAEARLSAPGSVEMTSNPGALASDSALELADLTVHTNPLEKLPAAAVAPGQL